MKPTTVLLKSLKEPLVVVTSLGNPEPHYSKTRHSIGHEVLNNCFNITDWSTSEQLHGLKIGRGAKIPNVIFFKPTTYMNLSGKQIAPAWGILQTAIAPKFSEVRFVVVHDELDKEPGQYQLRYGKVSSRGHNGLKSIVSNFGNSFYRFGVGIGRPEGRERDKVSDYVLAKMTDSELNSILQDVYPPLEKVIETLRTAKKVKLKDGKLITSEG